MSVAIEQPCAVNADVDKKPSLAHLATVELILLRSQVAKAVASLVILYPLSSLVSGAGVDVFGESSIRQLADIPFKENAIYIAPLRL